jgi:hypothetical protein
VIFTLIDPAEVLYPKTVLLFTLAVFDPMVIVKYVCGLIRVAEATGIAEAPFAGVSATYTSFVVSGLYIITV